MGALPFRDLFTKAVKANADWASLFKKLDEVSLRWLRDSALRVSVLWSRAHFSSCTFSRCNHLLQDEDGVLTKKEAVEFFREAILALTGGE